MFCLIFLCPTRYWYRWKPFYNEPIPEPDSVSHINIKNSLQGFTVMLNFPRKQLPSREKLHFILFRILPRNGTTLEVMATMKKNPPSTWVPVSHHVSVCICNCYIHQDSTSMSKFMTIMSSSSVHPKHLHTEICYLMTNNFPFPLFYS